MSWQVQADEPLFAGLFWDQPQTKAQQPRLLVIGGREQSLAGPLALYRQLQGNSRLKIAVPDTWQKKLPQTPAEVVFCPSNQSGSLAQKGLDQLLALAADSDGLIVGGSIGANRETARLVEQLLEQVRQPTVIFDETLKSWPPRQISKTNQIIVADAAGLGQLLQPWRLTSKPLGSLGQTQLMDLLSEPELEEMNLVLIAAGTAWVKIAKNMCYNMPTTRVSSGVDPAEMAGWTAWFAAQNPRNLFAAAATASYQALGGQKPDNPS